MIAGLENITAGEIRIGGKVVNEVPPKERDIAMVFQNYALYPHMTVRDNMAFSLDARQDAKADDRRAGGQAPPASSGSTPLLDRYPRQLSGGQRQRVAMGRAIVRDPQVFLFDEPLSNLDAKLRVPMRTEIKELHQRLKTTSIYVTHDQIEAMTMADQIVVMHDGRIEQIGARSQLYDRPANRFVAGFIGSPAMNFIDGTLRARRHGALRVEAPPARACRSPRAGGEARPARGLRHPSRAPRHRRRRLRGRGDRRRAHRIRNAAVRPPGRAEDRGVFRERHDFAPGQKIRLRPRAQCAHLFDPSSGQRI